LLEVEVRDGCKSIIPTVGYRISAAKPVAILIGEPARCDPIRPGGALEFDAEHGSNLGAFPAAPRGPSESAREPSMMKRSPRCGSRTTRGARSRNFASTGQPYVFGGSVDV